MLKELRKPISGILVSIQVDSNKLISIAFKPERRYVPILSYMELNKNNLGDVISQTKLVNNNFALILDNQIIQWYSTKTT